MANGKWKMEKLLMRPHFPFTISHQAAICQRPAVAAETTR
jgi:hypothetical protein